VNKKSKELSKIKPISSLWQVWV